MTVTRLDRARDLIYLRGRLWGPRGNDRELDLILDTGTTETTIDPGILDELGYNPRMGEACTIVRSAVGAESGYLIRVARFRALGHEASDVRVNALDLPLGYGIDGLLGLNFLRLLRYEVRSDEGRSLVERIAG